MSSNHSLFSANPLGRNQSLHRFFNPVRKASGAITPLLSGCNRTMKFDFEHMLQALVYFHLKGFESGRDLLHALKHDPFAREMIAPDEGLGKSTFFDALNGRGLLQFMELFQALQQQARSVLPDLHPGLGDLVAIDGSLIQAVASMHFADYRTGSRKAKVHLGLSINHGIPLKAFLSAGKADERPYVEQILDQGQTGVMDRYYQCHRLFDQWRDNGVHFICRIKKSTTMAIQEQRAVPERSMFFLDTTAILGSTEKNRTQKPVRVVAYRVDGKEYYIATDRFDLTAEQIAQAYKLRWDIEIFFGWWKRHLRVYHLIARSEHGLMIQILAGLITYILLAIYCQEQHNEPVSIQRVRELRGAIYQELIEDAALNAQRWLRDQAPLHRPPDNSEDWWHATF
jgi:hypothetical protein